MTSIELSLAALDWVLVNFLRISPFFQCFFLPPPCFSSNTSRSPIIELTIIDSIHSRHPCRLLWFVTCVHSWAFRLSTIAFAFILPTACRYHRVMPFTDLWFWPTGTCIFSTPTWSVPSRSSISPCCMDSPEGVRFHPFSPFFSIFAGMAHSLPEVGGCHNSVLLHPYPLIYKLIETDSFYFFSTFKIFFKFSKLTDNTVAQSVAGRCRWEWEWPLLLLLLLQLLVLVLVLVLWW